MTQEALLTLCSPQKPLASEARPKFVGTGLPAKPVLLRSAPKPVAPAPLAKAPRPPTKPVAAPILPQGWASPESSECPIAAGASQDGTGGWTHLPPIPCPATASPCLELVRSSTLNSEHFPQPTQQIKDIVRQHQQLPRGCQPEALRSAHPPSPLALLRDRLPVCLSAGLTAPCPAAFRERLFTQVVQMRCPCQGQREARTAL